MRKRGEAAFRRQSPIGPYIVDFECRAARVVVELDGGHHGKGEQVARDTERDRWLESRGYIVLRFWNNEVLFETDAVLMVIMDTVQKALRERYGEAPQRRPSP